MKFASLIVKTLASGAMFSLAACAPDVTTQKARSFLLSVEPGMEQKDVEKAFLREFRELSEQQFTSVSRSGSNKPHVEIFPYKLPDVRNVSVNSFRVFCIEDHECSPASLRVGDSSGDDVGNPNYLEQTYLVINHIGHVGVYVSVIYEPVMRRVIGVIHRGVPVNWPQ